MDRQGGMMWLINYRGGNNRTRKVKVWDCAWARDVVWGGIDFEASVVTAKSQRCWASSWTLNCLYLFFFLIGDIFVAFCVVRDEIKMGGCGPCRDEAEDRGVEADRDRRGGRLK